MIGVAIDTIYSSLKFDFPEHDMLAVCHCMTQLGIDLWHDARKPAERLLEGLRNSGSTSAVV